MTTALQLVFCIPTLSAAGAARTEALIKSVKTLDELPDRFFIVDNGGHFKGERFTYPFVDVYSPGTNIGVGPAWNEALRRFPNADIIFCNDDITLGSDSISKLVWTMKETRALMVGNKIHGFSFFIMSNELVRRVGYFDEGFSPAYYEDTDYLRRMELAGIERVLVDTGAKHSEQSTSRDMGWDAGALIQKQSLRYCAKWGGFPGEEKHQHPWGIDIEVCIPSVRTDTLQRLIESLAWQTVRPSAVTIVSNADMTGIDTCGLRLRQVQFSSSEYAIGEGDASLRRNVAAWVATARHLMYSDDDQVWPQDAVEWFARRFAAGEFFVVGHHRFVNFDKLDWRSLRNAPPEVGAPREKPPNAFHFWQSCWGGCIGVHAMLLKYGVGGWDQGYPGGEDQQLARRIVGNGDDSGIRVHEPPFAWHELDAVHGPPWVEKNRNTCERGQHQLVATDYGERCTKCPLVRRLSPEPSGQSWPVVQLYDPTKVVVDEKWLP